MHVQYSRGVSASEMTYIVSGGTLNSTYSLHAFSSIGHDCVNNATNVNAEFTSLQNIAFGTSTYQVTIAVLQNYITVHLPCALLNTTVCFVDFRTN